MASEMTEPVSAVASLLSPLTVMGLQTECVAAIPPSLPPTLSTRLKPALHLHLHSRAGMNVLIVDSVDPGTFYHVRNVAVAQSNEMEQNTRQ